MAPAELPCPDLADLPIFYIIMNLILELKSPDVLNRNCYNFFSYTTLKEK